VHWIKGTDLFLTDHSDLIFKEIYITMRIIFKIIVLITGLIHPLSGFADGGQVSDAGVVTIKSPVEILSVQKLPYFIGISADTAGSKVLSMNLVIIPPGGQAEAHYHDGFESAVYLIQGRVEMRYGVNLAKTVVNETGDFVFIPPNVPHQPRNLSQTENAIAIVTRNDPNEQESVVPYQSTED
jgi:uncharacterized RmlC-like cupin family protein